MKQANRLEDVGVLEAVRQRIQHCSEREKHCYKGYHLCKRHCLEQRHECAYEAL